MRRCPKCGSQDIERAVAVDRAESLIQGELRVATYRDANAWIFNGKRTSDVTAQVCCECGFLEFAAKSPGVLKNP